LIRIYERNEILGWALIFAGDILIENGVGGDYISQLRNSLVKYPIFKNDTHLQRTNDVINMTVELVKQVKSWVPGNKLADPYFSLAGGLLGIRGEAMLFENQNSLAPKILEVNLITITIIFNLFTLKNLVVVVLKEAGKNYLHGKTDFIHAHIFTCITKSNFLSEERR
jgi:hypothetical protein